MIGTEEGKTEKMRNNAGWFAFVALLGLVAGFGFGRFESPAQAQSLDNKTSRWLAGTVTVSAGQDAFMLFDSQTHRLVAYTISGSKKLDVIAVRDVSYDLKPVSFGKQEPTVQDMKDIWEKAEKERAERKPPEPEKEK